jgi:hypothetical protein
VFLEFKEPNALGSADATANATAFPDTRGKKIRESDRVVIWEFIPAPGPSAAPHHHARDAVVVEFRDLKPRVTFVPRGTVHVDEQTTGADRAYVFEVK